MTDLEITKLCAKAMGWQVSLNGQVVNDNRTIIFHATLCRTGDVNGTSYNPLHDDAQAMALVKKLLLDVRCYPDFVSGHQWLVTSTQVMTQQDTHVKPDLNRAICECVAKMAATSTGCAGTTAGSDDIKQP